MRLQGRRFGWWTVIGDDGRESVSCVCRCGARKPVRRWYLVHRRSTSCGCRPRPAWNRRHGESKRTKEYGAWASINRRCHNPNTEDWPRYGGRGIRVCRRWRRYENFLADMGRAPTPRHSVDRVNVNGHYTPANCRWATPTEQRRNQSRTRWVKPGLTLADAAALAGVSWTTFARRLRRGWTADEAIAGKRHQPPTSVWRRAEEIARGAA